MDLINARKNGNTRQSGLVNVKLTQHQPQPHVVTHVVDPHVVDPHVVDPHMVQAHLVKPHSQVSQVVDTPHVVRNQYANASANEYDYCE